MINYRSRESLKFFESLIDPENAEELKRTKTDIEDNISKILKLIKNENQSKNDGNPKSSGEETELVGLIEDLNKQYQSLYALYDRVTGEFGKVVSLRRIRRASISSSDSDSEYFSSEEVDGNKRRSEREHHNVPDTVMQEPDRVDDTEVNDPNQKNFSTEREGSTIGNGKTNEVLNTEASAEATEFEGQLNSQMKEMESLSQQKRDLELQVENHANEVKQLSAKNTELHDQVLELELLLEKEKGVVSNLQANLNDNENQAKCNIALLMAQVNEVERETKCLRTQKDEMEEKIKCDKIEASTQREDLMEQLNVMQQKLDSLDNQNKELETQMERKREQISQYLIQIENLEDNLAEMRSVEENMLEEKEGFLGRIKDLELELQTRSNQKNELQEQLRVTSYEIKQLENKNKALQDRNHELKAAMTQRGEEISSFLKENESHKNEASMEAMALEAEVNAMRLELDTLHEQKSKLELQNERNQKEYEESLAKMENLNVKLATQMADQEKTIKDQAATIDKVSAENKQAKTMSNKFQLNMRTVERKMEELAKEFLKKMEGNIRLLHQRIHIAEQLNNENKNNCNIIKQRYEEENKVLGEKVASYEEELRTLISASDTPLPVFDPNGFDLVALNGLDVAVRKVEEHNDYVLNRVSKMLCEVQFARDWIKKRNGEMKQLKDNVDSLKASLNEKEEQELLLREKVWNLEAKVSKEGGEKLNLMNAVSQLEKKVGKLEKNLKEKDEDLVSLGEKKREAIRQLCFVVDFHRDRCNQLKDLVTNMRVNKKV